MDRRRNADDAEQYDLAAVLLRACESGDLTIDECADIVYTMFIAGNDTVVHGMSRAAYLLYLVLAIGNAVRGAESWRELSSLVDEILRLQSPTTHDGYRRGRHAVPALHLHLHVHLAFVTKRRRGVPGTDTLRRADATRKVGGDFSAGPRESTGDDGHVHLSAGYPPKVAVSALVDLLKGAPARRLRSQFTGRVNRRIMHGHSWSPSCLAASWGGAPLSIIRQHIEQQTTPVNPASGLTPPEGRGLRPVILVIRAGFSFESGSGGLLAAVRRG